MIQYAVVGAASRLGGIRWECSCEFFLSRELAEKYVDKRLSALRSARNFIQVDDKEYFIDEKAAVHYKDIRHVTVTMGNVEDYKARVPEDMDHDDWVAENDDASVQLFRIIEVDASWHYENKEATESIWFTWDPQDCSSWDYNPLCTSLIQRVTSEMRDISECTRAYCDFELLFEQLSDFISAVYYSDHAYIDFEDYTLHAFRIPKVQLREPAFEGEKEIDRG